jgi:hypothetical protein
MDFPLVDWLAVGTPAFGKKPPVNRAQFKPISD